MLLPNCPPPKAKNGSWSCSIAKDKPKVRLSVGLNTHLYLLLKVFKLHSIPTISNLQRIAHRHQNSHLKLHRVSALHTEKIILLVLQSTSTIQTFGLDAIQNSILLVLRKNLKVLWNSSIKLTWLGLTFLTSIQYNYQFKYTEVKLKFKWLIWKVVNNSFTTSYKITESICLG